ncbi:unnamed protein product [Owenia fusiformis]|uniref:Polycystic kidney disease protein 1-like 2 n=1 Tax=Owenia fusiformis TaxID=6347 RepID=A0A8S4NDM9_OWEFU|nr:unnamed protein product [Owenia fusiformis]
MSQIDGANAQANQDGGGFVLPTGGAIMSLIGSGVESFDTEVVDFKANPFVWANNSNSVTSGVSKLDLKIDGATLAVTNLSEPISIYLTNPTKIQPIAGGITKLAWTNLEFNVSSMDTSITIVFECSNAADISSVDVDATLDVYVGSDFNSTPENFTYKTDVILGDILSSDQGFYSLVIPVMSLNGTGSYSAAIFFNSSLSNSVNFIPLNITPVESSCMYWDASNDTWSSLGCKIGTKSTLTTTHCECTHLTSFGSTFFIAPNKINFAEDLAKFATFWENPTVIILVSGLMGLYGLLCVWARRKDREDAEKLEVINLADNDPLATYVYTVLVMTGARRGAGTSANVTLTLIGSKEESLPHYLHSDKRVVCQQRDGDAFQVRCTEFLGDITAVRLWHDNKGDNPSWYVSKVQVEDMQTGKIWQILTDSWLAIDIGEGVLDKTFKVATKRDIKEYGRLISSRTASGLADGHIWFSVFNRPARSTFTRVQRLSCCISLLMCTMLTSIMFYGISEADPFEQKLDLGSFKFTWTEVLIGIQSSIFMFPINILIVQLFRLSKPPPVKKKSAYETMSRASIQVSQIRSLRALEVKPTQSQITRPVSLMESIDKFKSNVKSSSVQLTSKVSQLFSTRGESETDKSEFDQHKDAARTIHEQEDVDPKVKDSFKSFGSTSSNWYSNVTLSGFSSVDELNDSTKTELADIKDDPRTISDPVMNDYDMKDFDDVRNSLMSIRNLLSSSLPSNTDVHALKSDEVDAGAKRKAPLINPECESGSAKNHQKSKDPVDGVSRNKSVTFGIMSLIKRVQAESIPDPFEDQFKDCYEDMSVKDSDVHIELGNGSQGRVKSRKKRFRFPWWFIYIGWVLVILTTLSTGFFIMLYSMSYGSKRTVEWLCSIAVSITQSVFLEQPIKVICVAVVLSLIFKKPEEEEEIDLQYQPQWTVPKQKYLTEIWHERVMNLRKTDSCYQPPPPSSITEAQKRLRHKERMNATIREIVGYVMFLWILLLIVYGQNDRKSYLMNKNIKDTLYKQKSFKLLSNYDTLWYWMNTTLFDLLYDDDFPGFISTKAAYLVGAARLRQLRVKQGDCFTSDIISGLKCSVGYSEEAMDKGAYGTGWLSLQPNTTDAEYSSVWKYHSSKELDSSSLMASLDTLYSGSGYMADLGVSRFESIAALDHLHSNGWIDDDTRVLFVEFNVYNANLNLFTIVTTVFEMPQYGGVLPTCIVSTIKLYRYVQTVHIAIMACEIAYCVYTLYFIISECLRVKQLKWNYFKTFWNWLEIGIILLSIAAITVYVFRSVETGHVVSAFKKNPGIFHSFYRVDVLESALNYCLGGLVLLGTIKLLHMLRFNPRMYLLTETISRASGEIAWYVLALVVVFVAFGTLTTDIFGQSLGTYRNMWYSTCTLFTVVMGDFDSDNVRSLRQNLGLLIIVSFVLVMHVLVLNVIVTTVLNMLTFVQQHRHQFQNVEDGELVHLMYDNICMWLGIKQKIDKPVDVVSHNGDNKSHGADDSHNGNNKSHGANDSHNGNSHVK